MLPKSYRLPSYDIPSVMRNSQRFGAGALEGFVRKRTSVGGSRFAVVVSTRVDKRAVARNRMKRLVREALWKEVSTVSEHGIDGVIVVRRRIPDSQQEIDLLVAKLVRQARVSSEVASSATRR